MVDISSLGPLEIKTLENFQGLGLGQDSVEEEFTWNIMISTKTEMILLMKTGNRFLRSQSRIKEMNWKRSLVNRNFYSKSFIPFIITVKPRRQRMRMSFNNRVRVM